MISQIGISLLVLVVTGLVCGVVALAVKYVKRFATWLDNRSDAHVVMGIIFMTPVLSTILYRMSYSPHDCTYYKQRYYSLYPDNPLSGSVCLNQPYKLDVSLMVSCTLVSLLVIIVVLGIMFAIADGVAANEQV